MGDNSGSADWGLMQALLRQEPPSPLQPRQQDHTNTCQALLFHTSCGASCVQDWVGPEKRASLLRTQADTGAAEEIQDMHCLSLKLRSLAPCSPQAVGRASLRCRDFPFCPAFSCDPVDSSHNLWKVLWPGGRCWEVFKGKRCLVSPLVCLLARSPRVWSAVARCGPHVHFAG